MRISPLGETIVLSLFISGEFSKKCRVLEGNPCNSVYCNKGKNTFCLVSLLVSFPSWEFIISLKEPEEQGIEPQ